MGLPIEWMKQTKVYRDDLRTSHRIPKILHSLPEQSDLLFDLC